MQYFTGYPISMILLSGYARVDSLTLRLLCYLLFSGKMSLFKNISSTSPSTSAARTITKSDTEEICHPEHIPNESG